MDPSSLRLLALLFTFCTVFAGCSMYKLSAVITFFLEIHAPVLDLPNLCHAPFAFLITQ